MAQPIFIAFASQKGGVGKSTLAEIISSILYYERGYNILVIDCDEKQESFFNMRQRDIEACTDSSIQEKVVALARSFRSDLPFYEIYPSSAEEALGTANEIIEERASTSPIDIVIFDMPGRFSTSAISRLLQDMNYIVSPLESDIQSLTTSYSFIEHILLDAQQAQKSQIKQVLLLWNKVNKSANPHLLNRFTEAFEERLGCKVLTNYIYSTIGVSKEISTSTKRLKDVFRSSLFAPSIGLQEPYGFVAVVDELLQELNLDKSKITNP